MSKERLFQSRRVLLPDGLQEARILVSSDGKIKKIFRGNVDIKELPADIEVVDAGDLVVMAGIVDSHVHVNEPGREDWEGFWTATKAAAAGGVTTIVDMPLNSIPPTTTKRNLHSKIQATNGKLHVDVAFWGGVVPDNEGELRDMVEAGVVGFKCFLCHSGVEEFPNVDWKRVESALQELNGTNSVLAFHAETDLNCDVVEEIGEYGKPTEYRTYLMSRPPQMEVKAIQRIIEICEKYRVRCHIVHLSAADALPFLRQAKQKLPLTVETCHHYLTLTAEGVPDGATQFKCCPPVRDLLNRERLWAAIASEEIDMVVSDHSPSTPNLKRLNEGNFLTAWGGIASVQFGLSLFWTQARKRGFSLLDVTRLLSQEPARLCNLQKRKGFIIEGLDADFVIWDPDASLIVEDSIINFKNKITPYLGMQLDGKVMETVVRGLTVYQHGQFGKPQGTIILNSSKCS